MIRRPPRSTLFPYTDALPICADREARPTGERPALPRHRADGPRQPLRGDRLLPRGPEGRRQADRRVRRSEEHTSELQSQSNLVCRLLLEKKKRELIEYRSAVV